MEREVAQALVEDRGLTTKAQADRAADRRW